MEVDLNEDVEVALKADLEADLRPDRRSTPGASGSIMETLTTGGCASENIMSSVIRKGIPLHTDRL